MVAVYIVFFPIYILTSLWARYDEIEKRTTRYGPKELEVYAFFFRLYSPDMVNEGLFRFLPIRSSPPHRPASWQYWLGYRLLTPCALLPVVGHLR